MQGKSYIMPINNEALLIKARTEPRNISMLYSNYIITFLGMDIYHSEHLENSRIFRKKSSGRMKGTEYDSGVWHG